MLLFRLLLIASLMMSAVGGASAAEPLLRITRLDGTQQSGDAMSLSTKRRELKVESQIISLDDVRRVSFRRSNDDERKADAATAQAEVRLRDGSVLMVENVSIVQDVCRFTVPGMGEHKSDLEQLAAIRFASVNLGLPKWDTELAQAERKQDRLFIATTDAVSAIDGFLEELQDGSAKFEWMKETRKLPVDRLRAVIFASTETRELAAEQCTIRLKNGSRLSASSVESDGDEFRIQTRSGVEFRVSLNGIERIECRSSRLKLLSEMKPEAAVTQNIIALPRRWRVDRSASGRVLQSDSETFERGLGMPIGTQLSYRIPSNAEWLIVVVALESPQQSTGECSCCVRIDGREVSREKLRGDARSKALKIDCRNGQTIELAVEPGANFDIGASVNWCDASFVLSEK